MTIDQRGSRRDIDRVEHLLAATSNAALVRPFERTAGDEVQAVADDAATVARLAVDVAVDGHWSVGIGFGRVELPLPESTRAGRGPAFEHARDAVDVAKNRRIPIAVRGADPLWGRHAQTAARMLADVIARRSAAGTQAVDLMRTGITQTQAAERLGITPQAMSQRLRAAAWDIDDAAYALVADLLRTADNHTAEVTR